METTSQLVTTSPSPLTHNGVFTVTSTRTGEHRTFRIRTQPADSSFCPGTRVVSLLVGPDNTSDYVGFGFVDDQGIRVWKSKLGGDGQYTRLAGMLERLPAHEAAGKVVVQAATKCRVCNKQLTDPVSCATGIGPVCGGR